MKKYKKIIRGRFYGYGIMFSAIFFVEPKEPLQEQIIPICLIVAGCLVSAIFFGIALYLKKRESLVKETTL